MKFVDANIAPDDNIATIKNIDNGLSLAVDTIKVKLSNDDRNWSDSILFDGLTLKSNIVKNGEGNYNITFTTQGEFDGHLDHSSHLFVSVIAEWY